MLNSCTSSRKLINDNYIFKENQKLQNINIYENLEKYFKLQKNLATEKGLTIICSKNNLYDDKIDNYYFSKIMNLSEIYNLPCSGYISYDNKIILIYSKKSGYINPVNYPKKFLKKIKPYLVDDWHLKVKDCSDDIYLLEETLISNHPTSYLVRDDNIIELKYNSFNLGKTCFNKKNYTYSEDVNLNNFRTIYPENCDE